MSIRVFQWGVGFVGRYSLGYAIRHSDLDVVGAKVFTEAKAGRDIGVLAGLSPLGISATLDRNAVLDSDADCVVYMPRDALRDPTAAGADPDWLDDLLALLRRGKNVVSPLAPAVFLGDHLNDPAKLRAAIDGACAEGGTSALFTGIDPGFVSEPLVLDLTSIVGDITAIRSWEFLDWGAYPEPDVMGSLGFGQTPDVLAGLGPEMVVPVYGASLYSLADALGVTIERVEVEPDVYISPMSFITTGGVPIGAGTIGALRFNLTGIVDGEPLLSINRVARMGPDMAPDWPGVGEAGGYRVEIDAFPPIVVEIPLGGRGGTGDSFADAMACTAARCVNAVPQIVSAAPGYHTFMDLDRVTGRGTTTTTDR